MSKMRLYRSIFIMILLFPALCASAGAADSVKDILSKSGAGDICSTVKRTIGEGKDARTVVKTAIELGHNACVTIKCALSGGASVEKVVTGAIEAGVTSAVVSRCALDSGAEAGEINRCLLTAGMSQCYIQPEGYPYTRPASGPLADPVIPDVPKNQTLSPSRF